MNVELVNIKKSYRRKKVLEDVSLAAQEGSCVGILGGNGCGKSTLLSVLAGVQKADGGAFLYGGTNLFSDNALRARLVGYVPQGNPLIEELTAWDNLRLWYARDALKRELSQGVLAMLGIDSFLRVPVRKMSGGMKKRLSIGCAVASQPQILLLDEPSSALDLICKERIYHYFESYRARGGILLLATHDVREMELCDKCYILKEGALVPYTYDGDVRHLAGKL